VHSLIESPDMRSVVVALSYAIYVYTICKSISAGRRMSRCHVANPRAVAVCWLIGTAGVLCLVEGALRLSTCTPVMYYPMAVAISVLNALINLVAVRALSELACPLREGEINVKNLCT
jgi:hypothetical protein